MRSFIAILVSTLATSALANSLRPLNPFDGVTAVSIHVSIGGPGDGSLNNAVSKELFAGSRGGPPAAKARIESRLAERFRKADIAVQSTAQPFHVGIFGRDVELAKCGRLTVFAVGLYLWNDSGVLPRDFENAQWDRGWIDVVQPEQLEERVTTGLLAELDELLGSRLPPGDPNATISFQAVAAAHLEPPLSTRLSRRDVQTISAELTFGAGLAAPGEGGDELFTHSKGKDEEIRSQALTLLRDRFSKVDVVVDSSGRNFIAGVWGRQVSVGQCHGLAVFLVSFAYWGNQNYDDSETEHFPLWQSNFIGATSEGDPMPSILEGFNRIVEPFASAVRP